MVKKVPRGATHLPHKVIASSGIRACFKATVGAVKLDPNAPRLARVDATFLRHGGVSAKSVVVVEGTPFGRALPSTTWAWGYNDGPKVPRARVGADDLLRRQGLLPITARQGDAGWHTGRCMRCTSTLACELEDVTAAVRGELEPEDCELDAIGVEAFVKKAKTFMLPVKSSAESVQQAWKVGHATETRALGGLRSFLRLHKAGDVKQMTRPGLLIVGDHPVLGASLDGLAQVALNPEHPHARWLASKLGEDGHPRGGHMWAAVEVKTAVAEAAQADAAGRYTRLASAACLWAGRRTRRSWLPSLPLRAWTGATAPRWSTTRCWPASAWCCTCAARRAGLPAS